MKEGRSHKERGRLGLRMTQWERFATTGTITPKEGRTFPRARDKGETFLPDEPSKNAALFRAK
jgi:hypothetical protein